MSRFMRFFSSTFQNLGNCVGEKAFDKYRVWCTEVFNWLNQTPRNMKPECFATFTEQLLTPVSVTAPQ